MSLKFLQDTGLTWTWLWQRANLSFLGFFTFVFSSVLSFFCLFVFVFYCILVVLQSTRLTWAMVTEVAKSRSFASQQCTELSILQSVLCKLPGSLWNTMINDPQQLKETSNSSTFGGMWLKYRSRISCKSLASLSRQLFENWRLYRTDSIVGSLWTFLTWLPGWPHISHYLIIGHWWCLRNHFEL